jgi:hypothetical protein
MRISFGTAYMVFFCMIVDISNKCNLHVVVVDAFGPQHELAFGSSILIRSKYRHNKENGMEQAMAMLHDHQSFNIPANATWPRKSVHNKRSFDNVNYKNQKPSFTIPSMSSNSPCTTTTTNTSLLHTPQQLKDTIDKLLSLSSETTIISPQMDRLSRKLN